MSRKRFALVAMAALGGASAAQAALVGTSVGINFGANYQDASLTAADVAGVIPQANWNNGLGPTNTATPLTLNADVGGLLTTTGASATWTSNNLWANLASPDPDGAGPIGATSENNNAFLAGSPNQRLMRGYLDTANATTTTVTINGVQGALGGVGTLPYNVIIYAQGGVPGRGGTYTVNGVGPQFGETGGAGFNGSAGFVPDPGTDTAHNLAGNFLFFPGITGDTLTIVGTTQTGPFGTTPRAPINAIQILGADVPEPTALGFIGLGAAALLGRRRKV